MSDTALNKIIQYGTQAERIAFTPDPAVGSQVLYLWYETDNPPDVYAWDGAAWDQINAAGGGDVSGPGTSTDEALVRWNGAGGISVQNSVITLTDAGALGFPDNVRQTFNPGADAAGLNVGSLAGDPGTPSNGDLWYDSTANELTARINGANVSLGGGGGAPADAEYLVETANGSLSAEVVTGTTYMTTAAYGSRQAAAKAGRLFLPNNGMVVERDTGAAWAPWGPIFPFTAPVDGDFAWVNQETASVDTTFGGIYLSDAANAALDIRLRKKAAPTVPYTITAVFRFDGLLVEFHQFGMAFRQASDGKLHVFSLQTNGANSPPFLGSNKYTDANNFSASYAQARYSSGPLIFMRIADDNTNRICSYSADGQHWQVFHSVGRTDFLTADEVGFFILLQNGTYGMGVTLLSWKEA